MAASAAVAHQLTVRRSITCSASGRSRRSSRRRSAALGAGDARQLCARTGRRRPRRRGPRASASRKPALNASPAPIVSTTSTGNGRHVRFARGA